MDSTTQVTNDTGLVIAMEVPIKKSAHCRRYHSDSNRSRECVDLLTANRSRELEISTRNQLPHLHMTHARGSKSPNPSDISWIHHPARPPDTNYHARDPPCGGNSVLVHSLIGFRNLCQKVRVELS